MRALYRATCPACHEEIAVGTVITKAARVWVHEQCAAGLDPATSARLRDDAIRKVRSPHGQPVTARS